MTIEIHRPELEALILQRMRAGAFASIEDVLMQALESAPLPSDPSLKHPLPAFTGADLVAAMQMSPSRDVLLEPSRSPMPVRDLVF